MTSTSRKKGQAAEVDWSLRPRGTASAAVQGTLALAALATAGDLASVHPLWGGAATAAASLATVVRSAYLAHPPASVLYRLGCALGAGSWLTWTLTAGLWQQSTWAALGLGALTAGLLAPLGRATHRAPRPTSTEPSTALVPRRHARVAEEWADRIYRCCNRLRVQVEDVQEWPTKTGYSLLIVLPPGGATASRLKSAAEGMANDARLPRGCGIEITPGDLRGTLWMHVSTVNRLAETIYHPGDFSPRSLLDGITIGEYRTGEPVTIQVREPRAIVVGTTGSGKSGTLHTITAELGRCTDGLVWHMDLNGGGIAQAWLRPWLDGQTDRPAVDWAAPCPEEALLMADAEVNIAIERKTLYAKRRLEADTDLLPIGPDVPQITMILDEGAEVLAPSVRNPIQRQIQSRIEEIARIGRAEACQVLVSALRSISSTLSTDLLSRLHTRIIMAGCEQKEIDYLYDHASGPTVEDLAGPGSGLIRSPVSREIRVWRCWRMTPAQHIRPAALAIARIRPELDAPSVAAAGEAYATRYERMRWLFSTPEERAYLPRPRPIELPMLDERGRPLIWDPAQTHPAENNVHQAQPTVPAPRPATPAAALRPRLTLVQGGQGLGDATAWPDLRTLQATPAPAAPRLASAADWPDIRRPATPRPPQAPAVAEAPEHPLPEILARALAAFEESGDDRMHSADLAAALGLTQVELAALLRPLGVTTLPRAFVRGGHEARGYARETLEAAAERIRRGEIDIPAEVATWPA